MCDLHPHGREKHVYRSRSSLQKGQKYDSDGEPSRERCRPFVKNYDGCCSPWERERARNSVSASAAIAPVTLITRKATGAPMSRDRETGCSVLTSLRPVSAMAPSRTIVLSR
jgi:hypothetical protein